MKGMTSAVALLADASIPLRPLARPLARPFELPVALLSASRASHVGLATFALLAFGLLVAIGTTPDPLWWHLHFSQLGTFTVFSGHVFNTTIVLTSIGVVLFALRVRAEMKQHAGTAVLTSRRAATIVPILIALLGIHLSVVGFVPVNANEFLHDRGSTGAVLCFVTILASSRWTLRGMHRIVARTTRRVSIGLVLTTAPYIAGFINLALFELIVFSLVFAWLLIFAGAVGKPAAEPVRRTSRTGSMAVTVVVPVPPVAERATGHVAAHLTGHLAAHAGAATRGPALTPAPGRASNRPRRSTVHSRRRPTRGQSARQSDPEHPGTRAEYAMGA